MSLNFSDFQNSNSKSDPIIWGERHLKITLINDDGSLCIRKASLGLGKERLNAILSLKNVSVHECCTNNYGDEALGSLK